MDDTSGIVLISETSSCIKCGSSEDFSRLLDEYIRIFEQYSFCGFSNIDAALTDNAIKLLTAFASGYPAEFEEKTIPAILKNSVYSAAANAISDNSPAALTILKKLDINKLVDYEKKWLVSMVIFSNNAQCIKYIKDNTNNFSELIFTDTLFYLQENELTDILDNILTGRTEDEIKAFLTPDISSFSLGQNIPSAHNYIDICYDICVRYIPRIRASSNIPDAVSEFLGDKFLSMLGCLSYGCFSDRTISKLASMKRLGLHLKDITDIVYKLALELPEYPDKDFPEKLKEHYFPVFDQKLTVRLFYFSAYINTESLKKSVIDIMNLIGTDRICFDLSSKAILQDDLILNALTNHNRRLSLPFCHRLLKYGCGFITDEDLKKSGLAEILTMYPKLLGDLLRQCDFSRAQLTDLIFIAAQNKRTNALNVINKYILAHKELYAPSSLPDNQNQSLKGAFKP
ncbi:MAG: hypothetical protein MSJ26_02835 [Oscillospiraceae bacterium]|nr:hypothetical protein [Oscillospiraceae bacterium]